MESCIKNIIDILPLAQKDPHFYATTLFAPRKSRAALWTVLAFYEELRQIHEQATTPIGQRIRFLWWQDQVDQLQEPGATNVPLVGHLREAVGTHKLPTSYLNQMLEALEADPLSDKGLGALLQLFLCILGHTTPNPVLDDIATSWRLIQQMISSSDPDRSQFAQARGLLDLSKITTHPKPLRPAFLLQPLGLYYLNRLEHNKAIRVPPLPVTPLWVCLKALRFRPIFV